MMKAWLVTLEFWFVCGIIEESFNSSAASHSFPLWGWEENITVSCSEMWKFSCQAMDELWPILNIIWIMVWSELYAYFDI